MLLSFLEQAEEIEVFRFVLLFFIIIALLVKMVLSFILKHQKNTNEHIERMAVIENNAQLSREDKKQVAFPSSNHEITKTIKTQQK